MKQHLTFKQYLSKNTKERAAYIARSSGRVISTLCLKWLEELEKDILKRSELDRKNIIVGIDFFNGPYVLIQFANNNTTGHIFTETAMEIFDELNIPYEKAYHGKASLFIDKDLMLNNMQTFK